METYNKEASVPYYFMKGKKETPNSCLAAEKRYEKKLKNWNMVIIKENFPITSNTYQNEELSPSYFSRKGKIPCCLFGFR